MINRVTVLVTGLALAAASGVQSQPAPSTPAGIVSEVMLQFEASMEKFIALSEAMPAEKYGWSPGPGLMTVAKVYAHVARYNYLYPATSLGAPAPDQRDGNAAEDVADKATLVSRLKESRDHVRAVVKGLENAGKATTQYGRAVPQWSVLLQLVSHMNEHLGQSVAYARTTGVVPPWAR